MKKLALILIGLAGCDASPASGPPDVVLVTLDTTRADRLGCYGGAGDVTPVLDELARGGIRFARAFAPVPLTLPSHATLHTGLLPPAHGVRANGVARLPGDVQTLAECLQRRGYSTAAFVASFVLSRSYGLAQGFDVFDDDLGAAPGVNDAFMAERPARRVTDAAVAWLQQRAAATEQRPAPCFLWVHYFDPHFPYWPEEDLARRHPGDPYAAEIATMDRHIGRLLEAVRRLNPGAAPLLVIAADHGESLGEHGEKSHGHFLYQGTQHIPLLLNWEGHLEAAVRDHAVGLDAVAPTVLRLALGEAAANELGTQDLLHAGSRLVYMESELPRVSFGFRPLAGVTDGRYKLIVGPETLLFDLERDPDELRNLFHELPQEAARLGAALQGFQAQAPVAGESVTPSAETREILASLGYFVGEGGAAVTRDDWSPEELLRVIDLRDRSRDELLRGEFSACLETANRLVQLAPGCYQGHENAGTALARMERWDEARAALEAALALQPQLPDALWNLATCLFRLGRTEQAYENIERLLRQQPRHVPGLQAMADRALREGDIAAARRSLRRILEVAGDGAEGRWARARLDRIGEGPP